MSERRVPETLSPAHDCATDRVAEIRARLAATTPGPWVVHSDPTFTPLRAVAIHTPDGWDYLSERISPDDASLMANAPADLSWLLAELEDAYEDVDEAIRRGLDAANYSKEQFEKLRRVGGTS